MRLFIALDLPEHVKAYIKTVQQKLKKEFLPEGVYTKAPYLHITLLFIGNTSPEECSRIIPALEALDMPISWDIVPVRLEYNYQRPHVVWMRLESSALCQMHERLQRDVFGDGASYKSFIPHCTLVRARTIQRQRSLAHFLENEKMPSWSFNPVALSLKRSDTFEDGVRYTDIYKRILL